MNTSLHYIHKNLSQDNNNSPIVIMLHGRGTDEHDLIGLAPITAGQCEVYSLRAPYNYEWGGFTWFEMNGNNSVSKESFEHSYTEVLNFVSQFDGKKIFLMGFSMGTIMSYALALTQPTIFSGVIALSGFVPEQAEWLRFRWDELQTCPFFISHGIHDEVLSIALARRSHELFKQSNAVVSYHEYNMAHEINDECLNDVREWMEGRK